MRIALDNGAFAPTKAHEADGGYDLLCHVEYKTMFDYKTDDNGFCHKWERMVTSDGNV